LLFPQGVPTPASQRVPLKSGYAGAAARPPAPAGSPASGGTAAVVPGGSDQAVTTATLASLPADAQKQLLGERLYPGVQNINGELAGKITGMLLEMDNAELLLLLESGDALNSKVRKKIARNTRGAKRRSRCFSRTQPRVRR
jgi:polyadenylate-binding protein